MKIDRDGEYRFSADEKREDLYFGKSTFHALSVHIGESWVRALKAEANALLAAQGRSARYPSQGPP